MLTESVLTWKWKQVETERSFTLDNGAIINPVATLEDKEGNLAHIWIDDHCYLHGKEGDDKRVSPDYWLAPDIFDVLKTLPRPN